MSDRFRPPRYPTVSGWRSITWRLHAVTPCDWCGRRPSGLWVSGSLSLCTDCANANDA